MQNLNITLIQTTLFWNDPDANLKMFDQKINAIPDNTDLIVLPEMFTTGFSMNAEPLAQDMNGKAVAWLIKKAGQKKADILGSMIIRDKDKFYNRLIWARPDGTILCYDKKHLFRYAGEEKVFTPGTERITVELCGWKIRPFICYDLRFPLWTRNFNNQFDVAVFIANWPQKRAPHWNALLKARAIENQCYVAAVNIVGTDGNGLAYQGDSCLIDPLGNDLIEKSNRETIYNAKLSYEILTDYRKSFPAWMDAD
ncbi:MAG: amidohydrolase [Desulfobacterium sp.]|nr:amidohydrolase [Desulfobacterium sp.]